MPAFPEEWMSELLARNDIVSVISEYLPLKEKSRRFWGCCPFHNEKTPSFSVEPEKQFYYCFGCHAGGDVIHFVMEQEKLSFIEAVKLLANRANMPLPDQVDDQQYQKQKAFRDRLYEICREAALYYHELLKSPQGRIGRSYLQARGISEKTMVRFGLGYALPEWESLKKHLLQKGFGEDDMLACGLLKQKKERNYDAFRGRVMYPIVAGRQKVIGFGARALGDEQPKYLNSPETEIFNKRKNLYGLNMLKGQRLEDIVIVEGYMDVIGLYQVGVTNAVASLGTALTMEQARLIKRHVPRVYLAYDGDFAGQNATLRGMDILSEEGLEVKVVKLPQGIDPDEFVKEEGKEAFEVLKNDALSLNSFRLEHLKNQYDLDDPDAAEQFAQKASAFIAGLSPLERERYYRELSRQTGFSINALVKEGEMQAINQEGQNASSKPKAYSPQKRLLKEGEARNEAERFLLKAVLTDASLQDELSQNVDLLHNENHQALAIRLINDTPTEWQKILSGLPIDEAAGFTAIMSLVEPENPQKSFKDSLSLLKRIDIEDEILLLQKQADDENLALQNRLELTRKISQKRAELSKL